MALNLDAKAPPRGVMLGEWPRAAVRVGMLPFAWRDLMAAPRGDGRPVLALPGLVNSDNSNLILRYYLNALGYRAYPWALGRNFGPRAIGVEGERLFERIAAIHAETGERVTLIGVSLGGIMARVAAHRAPELVRYLALPMGVRLTWNTAGALELDRSRVELDEEEPVDDS